MQRLSSVNRVKNNVKDQPTSKREKLNEISEIQIPIDILFLISRMNRKIIPPKPRHDMIYINSKRGNNTTLYLTGHFRWVESTGMKTLKRIEMSNCGNIPLRYFEGLKLKSIVLKNVIKIEEHEFENFCLESLHIKDSQMSLQMLLKTISCLSPRTLILENIRNISEVTDELKILDLLSKKNILNVQLINSFINIDRFIQFVISKRLNVFYYKSNDSFIRYSTVCQHLSYLKIRNVNISKYFNMFPEWGTVDLLSTDSNAYIQSNIDILFSRVKFLKIEDTRINNDLIRKLPNLVSIYLVDCCFENMCFYKLIDTQSSTLKSISFKNISIPFDGYQYIKSKINSCKIIRITEDKSFLYSEQDTWIPQILNNI